MFKVSLQRSVEFYKVEFEGQSIEVVKTLNGETAHFGFCPAVDEETETAIRQLIEKPIRVIRNNVYAGVDKILLGSNRKTS